MKKLLLSLLRRRFALRCAGARPTKAAIRWTRSRSSKMTDLAALQNGAKLFVNYCLNCHSAVVHALQPPAPTSA